ncbi:MAG: hypothetical protein AB1567_11085 [bacterium]
MTFGLRYGNLIKTISFKVTKMKKLLILSLIFIILPNNSFSQDKIREELAEIKKDITVLKEEQKTINKGIDDLDESIHREIGNLRKVMVVGFWILFIGLVVLIGFVITDRRNALAIERLNQSQKAIEKTLKLYAMKEPKFAEEMQVAGLL